MPTTFRGWCWNIVFPITRVFVTRTSSSLSPLSFRGAGGIVPPESSDREIYADLLGKERQGKIGKMEQKRRKIEGKVGKLKKWKEEKLYQNGNFLPGKSILRRGKKSRKMTLPLLPVTPLLSFLIRSPWMPMSFVLQAALPIWAFQSPITMVTSFLGTLSIASWTIL